MFSFVDRDTSKTFVLNDRGEPVQCTSASDWAHWMDRFNRVVSRSAVGSTEVITSFVGTDLREDGDNGKPILWATECKIPLSDLKLMYRSASEAEDGHRAAVDKLSLMRRKPVRNLITKTGETK